MEQDGAIALCALAPLSVRPRECVERALAMEKIIIVVGKLVWGYEITLSTGFTGVKEDRTCDEGDPGNTNLRSEICSLQRPRMPWSSFEREM